MGASQSSGPSVASATVSKSAASKNLSLFNLPTYQTLDRQREEATGFFKDCKDNENKACVHLIELMKSFVNQLTSIIPSNNKSNKSNASVDREKAQKLVDQWREIGKMLDAYSNIAELETRIKNLRESAGFLMIQPFIEQIERALTQSK